MFLFISLCPWAVPLLLIWWRNDMKSAQFLHNICWVEYFIRRIHKNRVRTIMKHQQNVKDNSWNFTFALCYERCTSVYPRRWSVLAKYKKKNACFAACPVSFSSYYYFFFFVSLKFGIACDLQLRTRMWHPLFHSLIHSMSGCFFHCFIHLIRMKIRGGKSQYK